MNPNYTAYQFLTNLLQLETTELVGSEQTNLTMESDEDNQLLWKMTKLAELSSANPNQKTINSIINYSCLQEKILK